MHSFFEGNSISMEVMEAYEERCLEHEKKVALNAVRRELGEEYRSEPELSILFDMTLYYCSLLKNFEDKKSKAVLEALTNEQIMAIFGLKDGNTVCETLEALLKMPPIKPQRKKIDYSNPGSRHWKIGDVYAYPLQGEEINALGLSGKYALLHCIDIQEETRRTSNVKLYIRIADAINLDQPVSDTLSQACYLPSYAFFRFYRYLLISPHHDYPTDQLLYLGNHPEIGYANNEKIPPTEFHIPRLIWNSFDHQIANDYKSMIKFSNK